MEKQNFSPENELVNATSVTKGFEFIPGIINEYHRTLSFVVPVEHDGSTLQDFLRGECAVTAHLLSKLKQKTLGLTADGDHIRTIDPVRAGSEIRLNMPEDTLAIPPEAIELDILYEDDDLLAVNKPADIAVHPTFGYEGATLAGGVINYFLEKNHIISARPLNRLDRYTSGVALFAKNAYSAGCLLSNSRKQYSAIIHGELYGSGVIAMPIRRKPEGGIEREVNLSGKYSRTRWWSEAVDTKRQLSQVRVVLDTGRTHQIRVHFKWFGHPLIGDFMYGMNVNRNGLVSEYETASIPQPQLINRQALHCKLLEFTHPVTRERLSIIAPYPLDMQAVIDEGFE